MTVTQTQEKGAVVFLCRYQAPYGGNFIASLRALARALEAAGRRAVYLLPEAALSRPWCAKLTESGACVEAFDDAAGNLAVSRRLVSVCRQYGACLVHVHFGRYAASALAALRLPRLKLVWQYHSDFSLGKAVSRTRRIKRAAADALARLLGRRLCRVAVAQHLTEGVRDCLVLENALAPERLIARHAGRAETRAQLCISEGERLVLLFGWSPSVKGVDVAAQAVAALNLRGVPAVLGIVTGREYPEERMREWIRAHTPLTGTEPFLRCLPPTEDVFAYHEASDAMLSASRSEAFPYALLEAISALRPCAVTDIPGSAAVRALPTVFLARSGDAASLAGAIEAALALPESPDGQAKLALAKRETDQKYAIDGWVDGVLRIYGF